MQEEAECFADFSQTPMIHKWQTLVSTRTQVIIEKIMETSISAISELLIRALSQEFHFLSPPLGPISQPISDYQEMEAKHTGRSENKAFTGRYLVVFCTIQIAILNTIYVCVSI